jgi:hypothetical protein
MILEEPHLMNDRASAPETVVFSSVSDLTEHVGSELGVSSWREEPSRRSMRSRS